MYSCLRNAIAYNYVLIIQRKCKLKPLFYHDFKYGYFLYIAFLMSLF